VAVGSLVIIIKHIYLLSKRELSYHNFVTGNGTRMRQTPLKMALDLQIGIDETGVAKKEGYLDFL